MLKLGHLQILLAVLGLAVAAPLRASAMPVQTHVAVAATPTPDAYNGAHPDPETDPDSWNRDAIGHGSAGTDGLDDGTGLRRQHRQRQQWRDPGRDPGRRQR